MTRTKQCAVCGDKHQSNIKMLWQRHSDRKYFDICCACAESDKVNALSVDNFPGGVHPEPVQPTYCRRVGRAKSL